MLLPHLLLLGSPGQRAVPDLPQNVQLLRAQLTALTHERESVERRVLELTAAMCAHDEGVQTDTARMARLQRVVRRSLGAGPELRTHTAELVQLKSAVAEAGERKARMQAETDACVEKLVKLHHALDAADEQHNDDSLLQFMLFSSA